MNISVIATEMNIRTPLTLSEVIEVALFSELKISYRNLMSIFQIFAY